MIAWPSGRGRNGACEAKLNQIQAVDESIDDAFEAIRKIYDKYAGFAEDMQRIEISLQRASEAYHEAYKKLATGDGNLMRQLEKFRKDNIIKPRKLPPPAFQDAGEADD